MKLLILLLAPVIGLVAGQRPSEKGDCSPVPVGYAPISNLTSVEAFINDTRYTEYATTAVTPANYTKSFENLSAAVLDRSYITMYNLQAYSPKTCAEICDEVQGCKAFNIYVMRSPTQHPGVSCPNPPASATYRCALYSAPIFGYQATNAGQTRGPADSNGKRFEVRMKGSNGYFKNNGCTIVATTTATVTKTTTMHHTTTETLTVHPTQTTA